jgi:subtilisin family serine protease
MRLKLATTLVMLAGASLLAACGGGGGGGGAPAPTYSIGGTVAGLTDTGLVLQNNGGDSLSVASGASTFAFATRLTSGASYVVTIGAQPAGQTCVVTNGAGTVGSSDVAVGVACSNGFSLATDADPLAPQQWHLKNTGQNAYAAVGGVAGIDINVDPVYSGFAYSGKGTVVAVVDTGLEIVHEDLATNVVAGGSWNFLNSTTDPTSTATTGDHGTSVAGIIAMARNSIGGIGVAPAASLKGFNFLESAQSSTDHLDSLGGSASNPNSSDVAIFNQSYGVSQTSDSLIDPAVEAVYANGTSLLRGGKGAVYVKAAGNGFLDMGAGLNCFVAAPLGISCENANFDPENTIPYQIVVGATNANGVKASYSTAGSAIWISAPGGEADALQPAIITTDQSGCTKGYSTNTAGTSAFDNGGSPNTLCNYTNTMAGTSAAVPVVSGVIALLLEANPALTWRDVKHILATTAHKIDQGRAAVTFFNGAFIAEPAWTPNAASPNPYSFHNWYGFGMIDASTAVNMAKNYTAGQLGTFVHTDWIASAALSLAIPDNSVRGVSNTLTVPPTPVQTVEELQIRVTATHTFTGDLAIELTSPNGTRSVLKTGNDGFDGSTGLNGMVLISNAFYGESAAGNWTIKVVDAAPQDTGTLTQWSIRVYGH